MAYWLLGDSSAVAQQRDFFRSYSTKKYTFDDDFGGSYTFDDSESQPTLLMIPPYRDVPAAVQLWIVLGSW